MAANKNKKHQIEFLFPVAVFFFFTMSAIVIILFAARVYQATVSEANMTYNANTSLAYIREKLHQHNTKGSVTITELEGSQALRMSEDIDGDEYYTFIYAYDKYLRELFVKAEDMDMVDASTGSVILPVNDFSIEELNDRLLYFSCTDSDKQTSHAYVGIY